MGVLDMDCPTSDDVSVAADFLDESGFSEVAEWLRRNYSPANDMSYMLRPKYRKWTAKIISILKTHKGDREIVKALKSAGIISKSTSSMDVNFFGELQRELDKRGCYGH